MFLLCGCKSYDKDSSINTNQETIEPIENEKEPYIRDTQPGEIICITLEEMQRMIEEKKSFAVMFSTTYCGYCTDFHSVFDEYIKKHHVTMYEVILDNENRSEQDNLVIIHMYFPEFNTIPGVFSVKDGKEESYLDFNLIGINEEVIDEWVQEYHLDEKR